MSEPPIAITMNATQQSLYQEIARGDHADGEKGRIILCVSTDDLSEGKGDPYVGLGLAKYLIRKGWGVSLWPVSHWHETPTPAPDVAIVMIESFVPGMLPDHTATIAWVRNWADKWHALPYLDEFDAIWCSSEESAELFTSRFDGEITVVPIGVDPELFEIEVGAERVIPVTTTVNFWGALRNIHSVVAEVAKTTKVTWYGANREHLTLDSPVALQDRVDFFALPSVYSASVLVIDDMIDSARKYGNQNSRLFEAIACGAVPITNGALGLEALGLADVPTYGDALSLTSIVHGLLSDPNGTAALASRLHQVVHSRHSWAARAELVSPSLNTAMASAASRPPRSELLRWAAEERHKLQQAEALRDGHLITVRRLERESEFARAIHDSVVAELERFRDSKLAEIGLGWSERLERWRVRLERSRLRLNR